MTHELPEIALTFARTVLGWDDTRVRTDNDNPTVYRQNEEEKPDGWDAVHYRDVGEISRRVYGAMGEHIEVIFFDENYSPNTVKIIAAGIRLKDSMVSIRHETQSGALMLAATKAARFLSGESDD